MKQTNKYEILIKTQLDIDIVADKVTSLKEEFPDKELLVLNTSNILSEHIEQVLYYSLMENDIVILDKFDRASVLTKRNIVYALSKLIDVHGGNHVIVVTKNRNLLETINNSIPSVDANNTIAN